MPPSKKLTLPGSLLKEIGIPQDSAEGPTRQSNSRWKSQHQNRKDRRKAERSKKSLQSLPRSQPRRLDNRNQHIKPTKGSGQPPRIASKVKNEESDKESDDVNESDGFSDFDETESTLDDISRSKAHGKAQKRKREQAEESDHEAPKPKKLTRAEEQRLAGDDAEIAALERKLGIKGRKKLPKAFYDEGLGGLLDDDEDENSDAPDSRSRAKREADEWLSRKRRKATQQQKALSGSEDEDAEDEDGDLLDLDLGEDSDMGDFNEGEDDGEEDDQDDSDSDSFGGFEDHDNDHDDDGDTETEEPQATQPKVRENPYVAPVSATSATDSSAKYIPPSLRKSIGKDANLEAQVRRRTQGPVNRVTEANLLSIVGEIEKIYRDYPRGVVTDVLSDLLMAQICDPASKPDTLLVLSAGFISALYKVIGIDFAAHFVTVMVERFEKEHKAAATTAAQEGTPTKETSNLITTLSEMYMFRIFGSNLMFDFVRLLLDDLTELNAELLLRIVRMAGPQLRKDDPLALKDIVSLIRPAVAKVGEANLSVRTKFMIETISDLKNNKIKAGSQDLAVVSEHVTRMKKLLGSMEPNKLKASEPLRIGLQDIRDADKTGKWWLVGASWGGKQDAPRTTQGVSSDPKSQPDDDDDDDQITADADLDITDYAELAREQGMNTDVRRAIFIALVAAADFQDAHLRILKLQLNKYNRREIPNVLVQCAGAQSHYNPYYTLVASKFCGDSKIRYAFQDTLWTLFRRLGEPLFGEEPEDEDEAAADDRRLINTAKMFGSLVVGSSVSLSILKPLNLAYIQESTSLFVEVLIITILQECVKNKRKSLDESLAKVFSAGLPMDVARALRYFMRKKIRTSDLVANKKEAKKVKEACKVAEGLLEQSETKAET